MIVTYDPMKLLVAFTTETILCESVRATNDSFRYWTDDTINRTLVQVENMPINKPIYGLFWEEVKEEKEMAPNNQDKPGNKIIYCPQVGDIFGYKDVKYSFIHETGLSFVIDELSDKDVHALESGGIIEKVRIKLTIPEIEKLLGYSIEIIRGTKF